MELVLKQPDLSRAVFDDVVARTQVMKGLLQQHKDRIGAQLVRSKKESKIIIALQQYSTTWTITIDLRVIDNVPAI